jgi:acetyl-CoA carboxylase biotin carboxyl carrier protein
MSKKSAAKTKSSSAPVQRKLGIGPSELTELVDFLKDKGVVEFEWSRGDERVVLKTGHAYSPHSGPTHYMQAGAPQQQAQGVAEAVAPQAAAENKAHKKVLSPFVGTFYRSPSPTSPSYADPGKRVKVGDTLCIVEAMKLMNEIECEVAGTVIQVLVENGQAVEFGEPLFIIDTSN